jgi:hypothetical protein
MLNFHGSKLVPDGIFGPLTLAEVKRLQRAAIITVDGIVGPKTRLGLFPVAQLDGVSFMNYRGADSSHLIAASASRSRLVAQMLPKIRPALPLKLTSSPAPTAPPDPPFPTIRFQNLIVQAGNQFSWNDWAPSPFVASVTGTTVLRWSDVGWNGLKLSAQGQVAVNGLQSPNGSWTGAGAVQFQPISPWLDSNLKFFNGSLDLTSIFVQGFLQKNENLTQWQGGFAVGIAPSYAVLPGTGDDPILSLSLNAQLVKAWDLQSGAGQPVSPQIALGLGLDLWQLFHQK